MSKMKELDLLMQEVVDAGDEMREESEGVGLSSEQVRIVEYAFMQGFHAAGKLAVRPMQENIEQDSELQRAIGDVGVDLDTKEYLRAKLNEEIARIQEQELQITIEEIARIGLELSFHAIGHELDMSDEELLRVRDYLEAKEDEAVDAEVGEYVDTQQKDEQELKDIYSFIDGSEHPLEDFVKRKSEEKIKAKIQQEQDDE